MTTRLGADRERFHRRDFLRVGSAGLFGLGLADLFRLEARGAARGKAGADAVILVWLAGGPSTIDLWDLKPDAPENVRGEFKPVATKAVGVRVCEHLPRTAEVMDKCALVRSLHHGIPEHGVGTRYVTTGNKPSPALDYPSLGSLAAKLLPARKGVPPFVTFRGAAGAGTAGYLGAAYNPLEAEGGRARVEGIALPDGFSPADLEDRKRLRDRFDDAFADLDRSDVGASLDEFQQRALDLLRSDRTRQAFDLEKEPAKVRDRYGRGPFGQSALAARRLVEAGVRFVTVGTGGWDTHANNFAALRGQLLPPLDQGLSALVADLDNKGLLGRTVVYCAGEFGRTPRVNGGAGRDHWARAMSVLLAGGGLKGGYVHGSTDAQGTAPADDPCSPDDVSATVFHCLGIEPGHELTTASGRPVAVFREGKVLGALLS